MQDKILIVDDDELLLACFAQLLSQQFYVETATPNSAIEIISTRGPYAVVVADLRMPGLDGVQLLEKTKEVSPATVGIVLTGEMDTNDNDLKNNRAIYRVLDKPCPYVTLASVVKEALVHHHGLCAKSAGRSL